MISIGVNVAVQFMAFLVYSGAYALYTAMASGTAAGLIVKYLLDKRYIFFYLSKDRMDTARTFIRYTGTGVVTTALFWITEIGFDAVFQSASAKYLGAAAGLSMGYTLKYHMDKRMVFSGGGST